MHTSTAFLPTADDVSEVRSRVNQYDDRSQIYGLTLADETGSHIRVQVSDPRVARDYFAALAKAAQDLVDAADEAIVVEPLDLPMAVPA